MADLLSILGQVLPIFGNGSKDVGGLDFETDEQSSIFVVPYRAVVGDDDTLVANATIEEQHHDELEITEHPIEQGAAIADHAFKRPAEVVVKFGYSNSVAPDGAYIDSNGNPVAATLGGASPYQIKDVYDKLLNMQQSRQRLEVFTGKRNYVDMLLKSLHVTTDRVTENILMVTATFKQVLIARTRLVSVSAPADDQVEPEVTDPPQDMGSKALDPAPATFNADAAASALTVLPLDVTPTEYAEAFSSALTGRMPFEIPTSALSQNFDIALNGVTRNLSLNFNTASASWVMDVFDVGGNPLVQGISLVTGGDLFEQFDYLGLGGSLLAQTDGLPALVPDFEGFGKTSHLYYLAKEALANV